MKIHFPYNLKLRTNLGEILSKNYLGNELVRPTYKFIKVFTITNCKVYKCKTYNKTINNLIYRNRWRKTINEKL